MDYGSYATTVGQDEEVLYQIPTTPPPTEMSKSEISEIESLSDDFKAILSNEKRYLMLDMRQKIQHLQDNHKEQMIKLRATHIDFGSKRVSCDSLTPYSDATKTNEHVKTPMSAFMVWSQMERRKISAESPDKHNADISKSLGVRWGELSVEDREPYKIEAYTLQKFHVLENSKESGKTSASKKTSIDSLNYTQNNSSSLSEKQADNSCQQCLSFNTDFENSTDINFKSSDLNLMTINTNGQQDLPSFTDTTSQFKTETNTKYDANVILALEQYFAHPESNNTACDEDLAAAITKSTSVTTPTATTTNESLRKLSH